MTNGNQSDERAIFLAALEQAAPQAREAYLQGACAGHPDLLRRLQDLLSAHEVSQGPFDAPPPGLGEGRTIDAPRLERPGMRIGPYKLLQQIGEGGMGVVYMAEQHEPVRRKVALKIIKPGMDTRQVIARFEAERQALSLMDHPNIARVLDAGTTDGGRPYFVMELVKGQPITEYCDEHHLSPRQRLEMLLPVCQAIQHAHQKGIIHRDIKPSNVLVAEYDQQAVPKVIDFGVAKATSQPLTERTMFTDFGQVVGTLEYMSPEQAKVNQLDIDTRSDIYSLGVLLYELLTGTTPFDKQRLRSAAWDEMLRIIREEEPPKPSTRLSTIDTLPSVAANRQTEPGKLSGILRGELDWIVMKALDKDRNRRYETANGLAMDLLRYLHDEPVVACPPSTTYRFRKFARRNRAVLSTVALLTGVLLLGTTISIWQAIRATTAEREASQLLTSEQAAHREAEQAQEKEGEQRRAAESQRLAAETARKVAETARLEADEQRQLASARELIARRNLYTAHMNLAQDAWEDTNIPRVLDLLERHVPRPSESDWRSFEWYHLLGLCNQDQLALSCGHSGLRPAFSPDSKILAVSLYGVRIELWDIERRERTRVFEDKTCRGPLAFSPDGHALASAGDGKVKLWDVATGEQLRDFAGHAHSIEAISFTPDGTRIVSTDGGDIDAKNTPSIIRVWDVATGAKLHELRGCSMFIYSIAVSPDGNKLATGGGDGMRLWDLQSARPLEFPAVSGHRLAVSWSPDGKSIAISGQHGATDPGILVLDSESGAEIFKIATSGIFSLAFSPNGHSIATAHRDSTVRLWDIETGRELAIWKGHSQWVFHVVFSPDGKQLASVARDLSVKVWRVDGKKPVESLAGAASKLQWSVGRDRTELSPDGKILAATQDPTTLALVDFNSGEVRQVLPIGAEIRAISFSTDGLRLAVAHGGGIDIWDVMTAQRIRNSTTCSPAWTVDWSPDGRLLAMGTDDRHVELYDTATLVRQDILPQQCSNQPRKVAFSPDGQRLAVLTHHTPSELHLWDVDLRQVQFTMQFNEKFGMDLEFSPDGRTLAVSQGSHFLPRDGAVTRIIDVTTGTEVAALQGDDAFHSAIAFSPNGETLVTATSKGNLTIWDLTTLEERATFRGDDQLIESLTLTPDGRTAISSDHRARVRIWRTTTSERLQGMELKGLYRRATQYASDGQLREAIDLFTHILQHKDEPNIRASRARAFAELGEWDNAAIDFGFVTSSGRADYRPWYELALTQLVQGEEAAYRKTCAAMLERFGKTDSSVTAEFLCWTHSLHPQPDLDWGQLVSLAAVPFMEGKVSAVSRSTLGAVLLRAGLYEDAVAELKEASDAVLREQNRVPGEYIWYLLAQAHLRLGDPEAAKTCLARTQPLPPSDSFEISAKESERGSQWFRTATLQLLRHETDTLVNACTTSQERAHDAGPAERSRQAVAVYSRAIQLRDDAPLLRRLRARAHQRLGATAESAADLARAEQLDRELPLRRLNALVSGNHGGDVISNMHYVLERAQYRFTYLSDYDGAWKDCLSLLRERPNDAQAIDLFFKVQKSRGKLDSADEEWLREIGSGRMAVFYKARAKYFQQQGSFSKADADRDCLAWDQQLTVRYDAWKARFGSAERMDPWLHLIQARDCRLLGDNEQAEAEIGAATSAAPDDIEIWSARARLQDLWSAAAAAEASWAKAVELAGDNPLPWIHRGRWYTEHGQQEKADADFAQAASLTPHELNKFLEAGWWVVGPYSAELKEFCPPEVDPDPFRPVHVIDPQTGLSDQPVKWQSVPTTQWGRVDLTSLPGQKDRASVYALSHVCSPDERTVLLMIHKSRPLRLWVNGEFVEDYVPGEYPVQPHYEHFHRVPIVLHSGRNTILVKTNTPDFYVRIGDTPRDRAILLAEQQRFAEAAQVFNQLTPAGQLDLSGVLPSILANVLALEGNHEQYERLCAAVTAGSESRSAWEKNAVAYFCAQTPNPVFDAHAEHLVSYAEGYAAANREPWDLFWAALVNYRANHRERASSLLDEAKWNTHDRPLQALLAHHAGNAAAAQQFLDEGLAVATAYVESSQQHDRADFNAQPFYWWYDWATFLALLTEAEQTIRGQTTQSVGLKQRCEAIMAQKWAESPETAPFDQAMLFASRDGAGQVKYGQPYLARGKRLAALSRFDEAEADFNKAFELKPEDLEVLGARARFFADRGQPDKAAAELGRELRRLESLDEPARWFPQQTIAVVALSRATVFDSLVRLCPNEGRLWAARLAIQAWEGDVDAARDAAAHLEPFGWEPLRAAVAVFGGNASEFERLRDSRPKDWNPSWSTDLLLLTPSAEPITSELLSAAEQMLKSDPQDTGVRCLWAIAQYRANKLPEAMAVLESPAVFSQRPESVPVLAMIQHRLGNQSEARRWLTQSELWMDCRRAAGSMAGACMVQPGVVDETILMRTAVLHREAKALIETAADPTQPPPASVPE